MNDFTRPKVGESWEDRSGTLYWIIEHDESEPPEKPVVLIMWELVKGKVLSAYYYTSLLKCNFKRRPDKDVSAKKVIAVAKEEGLL